MRGVRARIFSLWMGFIDDVLQRWTGSNEELTVYKSNATNSIAERYIEIPLDEELTPFAYLLSVFNNLGYPRDEGRRLPAFWRVTLSPFFPTSPTMLKHLLGSPLMGSLLYCCLCLFWPPYCCRFCCPLLPATS